MEDNDVQAALKQKAQVEMNLQQKIDEAAEGLQAKIALRELTRRLEIKSFPIFPNFDDPTDDIIASEARDGSDELSIEMGRRNDHQPKTSTRFSA